MQIDIGAALGAERPQYGVGGLAADRALAGDWFGHLCLGHECNMGKVEWPASVGMSGKNLKVTRH
jgi:hypothetical protein